MSKHTPTQHKCVCAGCSHKMSLMQRKFPVVISSCARNVGAVVVALAYKRKIQPTTQCCSPFSARVQAHGLAARILARSVHDATRTLRSASIIRRMQEFTKGYVGLDGTARWLGLVVDGRVNCLCAEWRGVRKCMLSWVCVEN